MGGYRNAKLKLMSQLHNSIKIYQKSLGHILIVGEFYNRQCKFNKVEKTVLKMCYVFILEFKKNN